ncbi:hypothetical protein LB505_013937 [Fusarium chuoi]|nr:hypothetical protein LB505_013937 [Fusarium chuoi]
MALYAGLQMGALFWGFGADIIGRRIAFNTTLFIAAIATIVAGAGPSWVAFCVFVAFLGFGAGGNLVLDPTVMLEFVPAKQHSKRLDLRRYGRDMHMAEQQIMETHHVHRRSPHVRHVRPAYPHHPTP